MVSHLGENPVRKWSQRGWRAMISFTLIPHLPLGPKYPPFLYKRERGRKRKPVRLVLPRFFLGFFYSPTTSLLPPSESFRIEKRPFTGEDWRIRGEETEFAQTHKLFPSVSLFLIGYICEDRCTTVATRKIQNPRRLY